jgi:hypothetical protein
VGGRTGGRVVVLEKWVTAKEGTAEERGARSSRRGRRDRRARREGPRDRVHTADYAYTGRGGEEEGRGRRRGRVEDRPPAIVNVWDLVGKAKSFVCYAAGGGGGTAQAVRALQGCAAGMALGWRWDGTDRHGCWLGAAVGWAAGLPGLLGRGHLGRAARCNHKNNRDAAALIRAFPPVLARGASSPASFPCACTCLL